MVTYAPYFILWIMELLTDLLNWLPILVSTDMQSVYCTSESIKFTLMDPYHWN